MFNLTRANLERSENELMFTPCTNQAILVDIVSSNSINESKTMSIDVSMPVMKAVMRLQLSRSRVLGLTIDLDYAVRLYMTYPSVGEHVAHATAQLFSSSGCNLSLLGMVTTTPKHLIYIK